jgi:hypothetical protein
MYTGQSAYTKVGRLKPDEATDTIRIYTDSAGEIGYITRGHAESLLAGVEPQPVPPVGSSDLSLTSRGFKINVPSNGQLYVAVAKQVQNLIKKWPYKKAALFQPDKWGIDFWESEYVVTGVQCFSIFDINREWDLNSLNGKLVEFISGTNAGVVYEIFGTYKTEISIRPINEGEDLISWTYVDVPAGTGRTNGIGTGSNINLVNKIGVYVSWKYCGMGGPSGLGHLNILISNRGWYWEQYYRPNELVAKLIIDPKTGYYVNPDYPEYTSELVPLSYHPAAFSPYWAVANSNCNIVDVQLRYYEVCKTVGIKVGDRFRIRDPASGEYLLDDNSLPILSAPYWRASSGIGDAIATTAINWYWDGAGTVYLSYDPVKIGPIMFDDEIRIDVQNGTDLRIRDYAIGAERIVYQGYTVSRDTPDITSLCRVGINTITVTVRDSVGGRVGYVSPVYVKRRL